MAEKSWSNGITTSSSTPSPSITSRLIVERHDQLRRRLRVDDAQRMRLERQHGVGALDHLPVADVDAVEGPDRELARAAARRPAVG